MANANQTRWVIERARALGFDLCGVTGVDGWPELERLPEWLARGYAGEMRYLEDPRRQSPARVLEGARSIIVCALNYNTDRPYSVEARAALDAENRKAKNEKRPDAETRNSKLETRLVARLDAPAADQANDENRAAGRASTDSRLPTPESRLDAGPSPLAWISRYAWGDDYHEILSAKLEALIKAMRAEFREPFEARAYVDTGPIVERAAAHRAGLGWLAKNTCLINEKLGSWLFLGVIVTTLELEPSLAPAEPPPPDLCGQCTLCLEACPTGALVEPYVLDARRCISYLTIELRGAIPEEFRPAMDWMVFGCDICQDVCPWNGRVPATQVPGFLPRTVSPENRKAKNEKRPEVETRNSKLETRTDGSSHLPLATSHSLHVPSLEWLASLTEEEFRRVFRGSAIKRTKWQGLVRNACVALGNALRRTPRGPAAARIVALLERLTASENAVIAEHAQWALAQCRMAG